MLPSEEGNQDSQKSEIIYKTKVVQFLNRTVPIILQNDNGPCPLIAICNVLSLRNNINLGIDISEVSSSRLLSLVAERLIDSNSNIEGKNEEYTWNQQQNIADALALLHHLVTGLDVNVRFRNIHDFEFTPECAVFDLLDIGLVHGWLPDPQDEVTSAVLAPHSYNTLVEKLVSLQATKADVQMAIPADAPGLHVPSPSQAVQANINASEDEDTAKTEHYMQQQAGVRHDVQQKDSRLESDDDADAAPLRKGDAEENAQLLEALKLSSAEVVSDSEKKPEESLDQMNLVGSVNSEPSISTSAIEYGNHGVKNGKEDWYLVPPENNLKASEDNSRSSGTIECTKLVPDIRNNVKDDEDSKDIERDLDLKASTTEDESTKSSLEKDEAPAVELQERIPPLEALADSVKSQGDADKNALSDQNINVVQDDLVDHINLASAMRSSEKNSDLSPSSSSLAENSEHLNEGETQMALTASTSEIREPLYDGETNPAECPGHIGIEEEGAIINNFLKNNATQLTYYGLFCLQEGLKERELCVFFRNNHFSTMFKYKGEIYMLMTDQGYMNQPDIVWEKLDEVHGDTVFVTGNFTEFQAGGSSSVWDEQGAIAATTNYLSSHQQPSRGVNESNFTNRDLELAMSLQHQELEQQQQARAARHSQVDSNVRADGSRLITGPKRSTYTQKPEAKSKCVVM